MPSRRARVVLGRRRQHAPRVCAALVGELHAVCIRGTPTLPALELLPSEKRNLTDDEKRPGVVATTKRFDSLRIRHTPIVDGVPLLQAMPGRPATWPHEP